MQKDFHYFATYCAAYIAGYHHEEALEIAYSAQLVDLCSRTLLKDIKAPAMAATTQLQLELMEARTDILGLQDITRIWSSFHFLPRDLYADPEKRCGRRYRNKYRLICGPNGKLVEDTVKLAGGKSLQAAGIAMHVLADTWAHSNFAGTPSLVINNTDYDFHEILAPDGSRQRRISFNHKPSGEDDIVNGKYTSSIYQTSENSIMNLGHGRAGHLPDYSFARYRYLPAWGNFSEIIKDNPRDYLHAFAQMVRALEYLRGMRDDFKREEYSWKSIEFCTEDIWKILTRRQLDACGDWAELGKKLSGSEVDDFDLELYKREYVESKDKDASRLGQFIVAALAQKSMVTNRIFLSGNLLAGISVDFNAKGFKGIREFRKLVEETDKE